MFGEADPLAATSADFVAHQEKIRVKVKQMVLDLVENPVENRRLLQ